MDAACREHPVSSAIEGSCRGTDVVFVELPLASLEVPPLALPLLRAAVGRHGVASEIIYGNASFARLVGSELYAYLGSSLPQQLLYADFLFSTLPDAPVRFVEAVERLRFLRDAHRAHEVPQWLVDDFPRMHSLALDWLRALANDIAETKPRLVALATMFSTLPAITFAKFVKEGSPDTKVILGGASCERTMGAALHSLYEHIDFVCPGEGEVLLPSLVQAITKPGDECYYDVPGLIWRHGSQTVVNPMGPRVDLSTNPSPDFRPWEAALNALLPEIKPSQRMLPFETSRGCWYGAKHHCVFCGLNGADLTFRRRSLEQVANDLVAGTSVEAGSWMATDLIMPHKDKPELLNMLARYRADRPMFFEVKANLSPDDLDQLRGSGVLRIQPGIESLSTRVLSAMKKGVTSHQCVQLLRCSSERRIAVSWNLLYGFPFDQPSDYIEMARLIPYLVHLPPPTDGCSRIRVDRFSPLFVAATSETSDQAPRVRCAPAYSLVHDLPEHKASELAYHFEYDIEPNVELESAYDTLRRAVLAWIHDSGRVSFFLHDPGGRPYLEDRRDVNGCAKRSYLSAAELAIIDAAEQSAKVSSLAERIGRPLSEVEEALLRLDALGAVVRLDDRIVSLPTRAGVFLPPSLRGGDYEDSVAHVAFTKWSQAISLQSKGPLVRPSVEA